MSSFHFHPTGGVTSAGLLSSTNNDQGDYARSSMALKSLEVQRLIELLYGASFEGDSARDPFPEEVLPKNLLLKTVAIHHVGEFASTQAYLKYHFIKKLSGEESGSSLSHVTTSLEVEGFSSLASFQEALQKKGGSKFPRSVKFTLRRAIVTGTLKETPDGRVLRLEASKIAKLLFSLDHSSVRGVDKFRLAYSSSMCFVTDSAAAKYERINDPVRELEMLPIMFTLPLWELGRLSVGAPRPRQELHSIREKELLLSNFQRTTQSGTVFDSIEWSKWWESPLQEKLEFPFFNKIDIASLNVATRLRITSLDSDEDELQVHLRRLISYIHSLFTTPYYDRGGFAEVVSNRARVVVDNNLSSLPDEVLTEDMSGGQQHRNSVKLEVFDKTADLRKLYEVWFLLFDVNKIRKEMKKTKDAQSFHETVRLHTDEDGDFSVDTLSRALTGTTESLRSSIDMHLLLTRRALSLNPADPTSDSRSNRTTAAGLIRYILSRGGMETAFIDDFKLALTRAGIPYWLSPEKWSSVLHSPAAFLKKASNIDGNNLPSHYKFNPESFDKTLEHVKFLMTCPTDKLSSPEVTNLRSLFPLESVVTSGNNQRKGRLRRVPELAVLLFAIMSRNKKASLLDALEVAPFLSDEVKEEFKLTNWRYRSCRKRTMLVDELVSFFLANFQFNPRYCYGIHEKLLSNLYDIFLRPEDQPAEDTESSNLESLSEKVDALHEATRQAILPEFRKGLNRIVSTKSKVFTPRRH